MSVTVRQFIEEGRETLDLEVESGEEYVGNLVREESLNRPGLALAGFFQYFAHRRIQVLGLAESSFLKSLTKDERARRLKQFFERQVPAIVFTRNRHAFGDVLELAATYKIPVLRTPMITGKFMNAATLVLEELSAPTERVHGTMVDILGIGVLLEGEAGVGKSETALSLVERGHSLVADDVTVLRRDSSGSISGTSVPITRYHMEIRGLGIIHVPSLFGVAAMRGSMKLDLIVRLERPNPEEEVERTGLTPLTRDIMGVPIPLVKLPVDVGRHMAHVVEVAALNEKLKRLGHDAAKELDEKVVDFLSKKGRGG